MCVVYCFSIRSATISLVFICVGDDGIFVSDNEDADRIDDYLVGLKYKI